MWVVINLLATYMSYRMKNSLETVLGSLGDIGTLSIHCLRFLTHGMARLRLAAQQVARLH